MTTSRLLRNCTILSALALGGCPSDDEGVTGTASNSGTESETENDEDSDTEESDSDPTPGSNSNSDTMVDTTEDPTDTAPTTTDPTDTDATDTAPTTTDPSDTDPSETESETDPSSSSSSASESDTDSSGSSSESSGAVSASDSDSESDSDPTTDSDSDSGDPNCEAPGELISCDADTDDPFQAIGLGCEGGANQVIPISNTTFSSADAGAWAIASQLGTYIDPNTNEPLFSAREGDSMLVISTGHLNPPNGQGVITMVDADVYDANSNPDFAQLPAPMTIDEGSNNGNGGTPFVNCDGVGDCSDTILDQWNFGDGEANDMLWFQFETVVPGGTNGWSVEFAYFSVEFPEWVDDIFNDIFLVWSDSETYTGNLCFVNDQPCTVTALWPVAYQQNALELAGTGFQQQGGGTGWYTMNGSAAPGETLQLTTAIFDMGDTAYDTVVLLDNWRWDCEGCVPSEVMGCGIEPTP
jgi:hypothetical protein